MVQPTKYIWMDGDLISWDQAQVHVLNYTMHYGLGAFEGIRSYQVGLPLLDTTPHAAHPCHSPTSA